MYKHLKRMTDSTGMLQFSDKSTPLLESGYTVDDNARALLVAIGMKDGKRQELINIYIKFLEEAQDPVVGWKNLKVENIFLTINNSEDCIGRGFMALSFAQTCDLPEVREIAKGLARNILPIAEKLNSPRTIAYVLIGICNLIDNNYNKTELLPKSKELASKLIKLYKYNNAPEWKWFEDILTYCNGILPQALFCHYLVSGDKESLRIGTATLRFLTDALFEEGYLNVIGNRGWWERGKNIPLYDQQPVDAASIALACLQAYIATNEEEYLTKAQLAYDWYLGKNINKISVFNIETEGCHDAIVPDGVNLNQGAEAILSFLLTHQFLEKVKNGMQKSLIPGV